MLTKQNNAKESASTIGKRLGERSCLVLDMKSLDHGNIPTGFVRGSVTSWGIYPRDLFDDDRCFTWHYGQCVKMNKKRAKNLDTSACYFCQ